MTLRVGVIGGGLMGRLHARAYQSMAEVELVGIVELDESRHAALREEVGAPVLTDPARLWDDIDAASVCTPDDVRREVVLPGLDHGVRMLVEKPLATDLTVARELVAACPDPSYLMVGHILRFDPRVQQARETVRSGALGELWSGRVWRCGSKAGGHKIAKRTSVDWFLGVHDIDLVRFVTGKEITTARADAWSCFTDRRDLVRGRLTLEPDVPVEVEWSWTLPDERSSGLRAGLELIGSEGMLEVDLSHSAVSVTSTSAHRQANLDTFHWPPHFGYPGGDLLAELRAFVTAVVSGRTPVVTAEDGLRTVVVLNQMVESYAAQA